MTSNSTSLDGYGSKSAVSNESIPATRQEFFFTKVAPVKSMTNIVSFDF